MHDGYLYYTTIQTQHSRDFILGNILFFHFSHKLQGLSKILGLFRHGNHGIVMIGILGKLGDGHPFPNPVGHIDVAASGAGRNEGGHGFATVKGIGVGLSGLIEGVKDSVFGCMGDGIEKGLDIPSS